MVRPLKMSQTGSASSPLNELDPILSRVLAAGCSHDDINQHVREYVLEHFKAQPPVKVLYNDTYGGFGFAPSFKKYFAKEKKNDTNYIGRDDPAAIKAIMDYGREVCSRIPDVVDAFRVERALDLEHFFDYSGREGWQRQHDRKLVAKLETLANPPRIPVTGSDTLSLEEFIRANPDGWMEHPHFAGSRRSLAAAHALLKESREKYQVAPDPEKDVAIYELIGLACAGAPGSVIRIETVPAGVHYTIEEYDGQENVTY